MILVLHIVVGVSFLIPIHRKTLQDLIPEKKKRGENTAPMEEQKKNTKRVTENEMTAGSHLETSDNRLRRSPELIPTDKPAVHNPLNT